MAKLSLTQTFGAEFTSRLPSPTSTEPGRVVHVKFQAQFELRDQSDEARDELRAIEKDHGTKGVLDAIMPECKVLTQGFTDEDFTAKIDGVETQIPCVEWVKRHQICQQDALLAYWEEVNKGVNEKNLKKSRRG